MLKNVLSLIALIIAGCSVSFSEDWTLAAMKFDLSQNVSHSSLEEKAAADIPSLILEKIGLGTFHILSYEEQTDRELYDLQTKRLSLFLQLSREVKLRDELVLEKNSAKKFKKKIDAAESKILDIESQIKDNLEKAAARKALLPSEDMPAVLKNIAIYEENKKNLYEAEDFSEVDVIDKNIHGLITGYIDSYGEYAAVTAELKTYPGARTVGSVVEVGSLHDVKDLAQNLVNSLRPLIANSIPVNLYIAVLPEEAKESAKVFIDGVMQDSVDCIRTTSGKHTLEIESNGYFDKSIEYNFVDSSDYYVRVPMEKMQDGTFSITLNDVSEGDHFANGEPLGYIDVMDNTSVVTINGRSVIGQFVSKTDEGKTVNSYYYIPPEEQKNNASYGVKLRIADKDSEIEERRLWAYRGYSALMLSLPLTVFAYGRYLSTYDGYSRGAESRDSVNSWAYASRTASGISLIAGGFFLFELVRYLHSASSVLPQYTYEITNEKSEE
ncbi:MAG: hypothetical protein K6G00_03040 [Treponema sp.]|nr:hypothetical protein [Treponema sp.]